MGLSAAGLWLLSAGALGFLLAASLLLLALALGVDRFATPAELFFELAALIDGPLALFLLATLCEFFEALPWRIGGNRLWTLARLLGLDLSGRFGATGPERLESGPLAELVGSLLFLGLLELLEEPADARGAEGHDHDDERDVVLDPLPHGRRLASGSFFDDSLTLVQIWLVRPIGPARFELLGPGFIPLLCALRSQQPAEARHAEGSDQDDEREVVLDPLGHGVG